MNKFDLELNDEPFETIFFNCYYTLKNTSKAFIKKRLLYCKISSLSEFYYFEDEIIRAENKSIFTGLSAREFDFLSNLVKHSFLYGLTGDKEKIQVGCLYTLGEIFQKQISNVYNLSYLGDYFHLLIYLCCSLPYLFYNDKDYKVSDSLDINNLLETFKIILQFQCSQIVFNKIFLNVEFEPTEDSISTFFLNANNGKRVESYYKFLLDTMLSSKEININKNYFSVTPDKILETLKEALMPFLRCAALFFYCLNDLKPISSKTAGNLENIDKNFESLLEFFNISMDDFFDLIEVDSNGFNKIILNK